MSSKSFSKKRTYRQTEKRLDKLHYRILIGLMVVYLLHYLFLQAETIGGDIRYSIYIFWIPLIAGMIALAYYRRNYLRVTLAELKGVWGKALFIGFMLLSGVIFSYLTAGQLANATFNYLNKRTASLHPKEMVHCKITRFWKGRNSKIDFEFQNRSESFTVSRAVINDYKDEPPADYKLKIIMRKGIWNYYVVEDWEIIKVR